MPISERFRKSTTTERDRKSTELAKVDEKIRLLAITRAGLCVEIDELNKILGDNPPETNVAAKAG